ncbi:calponin homology domain-containing protein [Suillus placidus]|uniref:Calponin homology domain-containing protein n=1 Tax=Suillus placidus TaxID=48579 RepID=A0A9P6ZK72_9AGAM|nr:calponin homology domain-containing protein [Suillus placidus]
MWGFNEYGDGLILCKLINDFVPDTIDTRILNKPNALKPLNADGEQHHRDRNYKGIGCSVVWQIIRRGLLAQVDIKIHPELYRLCKAGETIDDLLQLTPDQILLAWFNYHLKAAGWKRNGGGGTGALYGNCSGLGSTVFVEEEEEEVEEMERASGILTSSVFAGGFADREGQILPCYVQ